MGLMKPGLLYHGTTSKALGSIQEKSILPRNLTRRSNWKHGVPSNKEVVYLTNAYPLYFAVAATKDKEKPIIVEVDQEKLDIIRMMPDEDVLEQAFRGRDNLPKSYDMEKRTKHYRQAAMGFTMSEAAGGSWYFEASLKLMGTCGHIGPIPKYSLTRIAIIDPKKQSQLCLASMDASISLMNYKFCASKYKALTNWIFGEPFPSLDSMEEWEKVMLGPLFEALEKQGRGGIEILGMKEEKK